MTKAVGKLRVEVNFPNLNNVWKIKGVYQNPQLNVNRNMEQ